MGQKQSKLKSQEGQCYSESKPVEILFLQILLENLNPSMLLNPPSQLSSIYQFLIQSQTHSSYTYGFKFHKNQLPQTNNLKPQHFNFPVQIFLLQKNIQNFNETLIFEGELFKGKRTKLGTQFNKNGEIFYQGNFKNNKYHGWGITSTYQGEWANGLKCGYGKFNLILNKENKISISYEGFWKNNKFNGLGTKNIAFYQYKTFLNDNYVSSNIQFDEQYIGEWLQGMKSGCGKLIKYTKKGSSINCQIYQGEFARDLYHGNGKLKLNSQNYQQGTFQNGKFISPKQN